MPTRLRSVATALALVPLLAVIGCGDDDTTSTDTVEVGSTTTAVQATTTTKEEPEATTTVAPSTTQATVQEGDDFPAGSPEAAAAEAYEIVFDSAASMEEKSPHIEGATALEAVLVEYATVGNQFNGFTLDVKTVAISGTTAAVTYDLYFGGSLRYPDLRARSRTATARGPSRARSCAASSHPPGWTAHDDRPARRTDRPPDGR